ncbi:MAG: (2Fe-2S)-binding protein [Solirubrobacterales bacterium]
MSIFRTNGIDQTISRISSANSGGYGILIRRRKAPGDGWFYASELAGGTAPAALLANVRGLTEIPADHIRAEWMLESVARALADLGGSFIVSSGRLPDFSADNILLAAEGGLVRATGMTSERMTVLADDPAASGDGNLIVENQENLIDLFREGFTSLLEPVVDWVDSQGLRPKKTLWHAAADRLAQAMIWSGDAFEKPDLARSVTTRVVAGDKRLTIPLESGVDDYETEYHLRSTCCLAYRTPAGILCQGCPLHKQG